MVETKPLKEVNGDVDTIIAMEKYKNFDKSKVDFDGIFEEERRSKAYAKIKNQSSSYQQVRKVIIKVML